MRYGKITVLTILIFLLSFTAFSQQVKFVDIPSTQQEIERLNQSTAEYEQKSQTLDSEITALEEQLKADREQLKKIEILVNKMIYKGALMKQYADNVVDEATKKKAEDAFVSYRESLEKLLDKKDVLEFSIRQAGISIEEKRDQRSANNHMIILNGLKVRELQKAIEISESQSGNIDQHIDILNTYLSEASTLLQ